MNYCCRLLLLLLMLNMISCGEREQCHTPAAFVHLQPESELYKSALLRQLKRMKHPRFYLEAYREEGNEKFITVLIQDERVCVNALLKATEAEGLQEVFRTKGKGYSGAELSGLVFEPVRDANGLQIACKSVKRILD